MGCLVGVVRSSSMSSSLPDDRSITLRGFFGDLVGEELESLEAQRKEKIVRVARIGFDRTETDTFAGSECRETLRAKAPTFMNACINCLLSFELYIDDSIPSFNKFRDFGEIWRY